MTWTLIEHGVTKCHIVAAGAEARGPAMELARHLAAMGGLESPVTVTDAIADDPGKQQIQIIVGDRATLAGQPRWAEAAAKLATAGAEGYCIRTYDQDNEKNILLGGGGKLAMYYAVYDLLETIGVRFFFDQVRVPQLDRVSLPKIDKLEKPATEVRCFKPQVLGSYSQLHSFWFWDQSRWEQAIRWCVQNRLNAMHLMCFAGMNWIAYRDYPEARVHDDPAMTTEARIRMTQHLIHYAHELGMKVWIGFVTNGAPYNYVDAHPEQACTGIGGVYEGDLCGRAGQAFLESAAREYFQTYDQADGFVFWPPEGQCHCADCQSGKAFVDLVAGHVHWLRSHAPDKRILLVDWVLAADGGTLPQELSIINMHEFSQLPPHIERGSDTIFDLIVNWDTGSCTTVSPHVHDMHREMLATHRMGVKGFEAHLVSAFSGEMNIQAFAAIAWDPPRFDADKFITRFLEQYYGNTSDALREAMRELEAVWTPPFNAYTSIFVSRFHHWAVPADAQSNTVTEITEYVQQPVQPGAEPVKAHRRLPREQMLALLDQAVAHLENACSRLQSVQPDTEPLRFLKVSAEAQWRYAQWTTGKYRTMTQLAQAQRDALDHNWPAAQNHVDDSSRTLSHARESLLRLKQIIDAHPQWFQTQRCVAERDLETWIGSQAVNDEVQDLYASSVIGGRCAPTAGLKKMESLVHDAHAAVRSKVVPRLKPDAEELAPFVRYPRQREKIIAAMRQRLAQAATV